MNALMDQPVYKDSNIRHVRLEVPKRDKHASFILAVVLHLGLLYGLGATFVKPAQYGVEHGTHSIEVNLVAAPVPTPVKIFFPEPIVQEKIPVEKEVVEEHKIALPSKIIGDGSSPKVGTDQTTVQSSGGAITEIKPNYLKNPSPTYPEAARRRGQEGTVMLNVRVDKYGYPQNIEIMQTSGFPLLDSAALKSVKRWSFQPAYMGSLPIDSNVKIPIRFELDGIDKR